jgi:hypothetical protein
MRRQPFMAQTVELFTSRRSFLAQLLAKRFRCGGVSEAGAWTDQKTGAARRRSANEGHRQGRVARSSCHAAELPKTRQDFARALNFNCCNSNSVRSANVAIRSRAL